MPTKVVRVFDFDNTIYNGNATEDFIWYLLGQHKLKLSDKISIRIAGWRLAFGAISMLHFVEVCFKHLHIENLDIEHEATMFWHTNRKFIKKFFWKVREKGDIIVSASPEFLLKPFAESIGATLVASKFDIQKGVFDGPPCQGEEKVNRLNELGIECPDEFYTDSMVDAPMIKYSKKAFLVKDNEVKLIWSKS